MDSCVGTGVHRSLPPATRVVKLSTAEQRSCLPDTQPEVVRTTGLAARESGAATSGTSNTSIPCTVHCCLALDNTNIPSCTLSLSLSLSL